MELKQLCNWFNELEYNKQILCLDFMNEKKEDLNDLTEEELENLYKLWLNIKIMIKEKNEDEVIKELKLLGLEKISATSFYNFCLKVSFPEMDARIINNIEKDNLKKVVDFIIQNLFIYSNFKDIKFETFIKLGDFNGDEEARRALRFLRANILEVCNREISPKNLKNDLEKEYGLSADKSRIIVSKIEDNIEELNMAYLLSTIKNVSNRLDRIENIIIKENENNNK